MATEEHRVVIGVDYVGQGDVARYLADLQKLGLGAEQSAARMARAMQNGQFQLPAVGPSTAPRALPAGGSTTQAARSALDLQRAQDNYVRELNERSAQMRAQRFQSRVAAIADRPAVQGLQFGPGGNPQLQFAAGGKALDEQMASAASSLRSFRTMLARSEAKLKALEEQFTPSARVVNAHTEATNRAILDTHFRNEAANQSTTGGQMLADDLRGRLAESLQAVTSSAKRLLREGLADYQLLAGMHPEERQMLIGTPEHPRDLGLRKGEATNVPGLIDTTRGKADLMADALAPAYREHREVLRNYDAAMNHAKELQAQANRVTPLAVGPQGAAQLAAQQAARQTVAAAQAEIAATNALVATLKQREQAEKQAFQAAMQYHVTGPGEHGMGRVVAEHSRWGLIGEMMYGLGGKPMEIDRVGVLPEFRRRGVASGMFNAAQALGIDVQHSPVRTTLGDAFAHGVGGNVPPLETRPGERAQDDAAGLSPDRLRRSLSAIRSQMDRQKEAEREAAELEQMTQWLNNAAPPEPTRFTRYSGEFAQAALQNPPRLDQWLAQRALEQQAARATTGVNMDRTRNTGPIQANPNSAYRAIGPAGFDEFLKSATISARANSKQGYQYPYFGPTPMDRYRNRSGPYDYVAEVPRGMTEPTPNGFLRPNRILGPGQVTVHQIDNATGESSVVHSPTNPHPGFGFGQTEQVAAQKAITAGLVHVENLIQQEWPEYEKAKLAVEERARAEQRAAQAAIGGGNGRSGGGTPPRTGGGGGPLPPPDDGGSWSRDRLRGLEEDAAAREVLASDKLMRSRLALAKAQDALEAILEKDLIAYGEKGGFKTRDEADQAIRSGMIRQDAANAQVKAAEQAAATKAARDAKAAEAAAFGRPAPNDLGVQHGPGMPINAATVNGILGAGVTGGQLSPLQAAQQQAAIAQGNLSAATKAHQQVMSGVYQNQQQAGAAYAASLGNLTRAQQAAQQAQQNVTRATNAQANQSKAAAAAAAGGAGGGGIGGFGAAFMSGFRGNPNTPVAAQLGQTARFSVFYGGMYKLLFAITATFKNALQEGIAFEDALTNLAIAAGKPKDQLESLANDLGQESVRAGFAPSQGVTIGAQSLGLYGVTNAPLDEQRQVAQMSARVVSQMAVGSKKDPVQLQGDIAAITQALGLGAQGLQRVADLDAYTTKKFGVTQGSTLEAVGQSASVGKAAGFTDEQLFSIAADMISRTGQTPSAVAGYMAQIFSRGGEGSLVDVAAKQGIDPNQDLAKIVQQLAGLYKGADPRSQAQISAAFGRGKVQNAAVALLSDYNSVQQVAGDAKTQAGGSANSQFEQHMANIGGQLREFSGQLRLLAQELGQSGLLDAIGAGVKVLDQLAKSANILLGMFNELPRGLRDAVLALAIFTGAAKMGAFSGIISKAALAGGGVANFAASSGVAVQGAALGANAASFKAVGMGLLKMVGPIALATGGLMAIASVKGSLDRMQKAQDDATAALQGAKGLSTQSSPEAFRAQAAELSTTADESKHATGWFLNTISLGSANDASMATAKRLEAEAKRLNALATALDKPVTTLTPTFKSLTDADVKQGMTQIADNGGTAATQLKALNAVLFHTASAAKAAADAFDPKTFAGTEAAGLVGVGLDAFGNLKDVGHGKGSLFRSGGPANGIRRATPGDPLGISGKDLKNDLQKVMTGADVTKQLEQQLNQYGVKSEGDLDNATAGKIADSLAATATKKLVAEVGPGVIKDTAKVRRALAAAYKKKLLGDTKTPRATLAGSDALSAKDATALAGTIVTATQADLADMAQVDFKGRAGVLQGQIRSLRQTQRKQAGSALNPTIQLDLAKARADFVDNQLAEADALRKSEMANARSRAAATAAGQRALRTSLQAIVKNGTADQLAQLLAGAGAEAGVMVRKMIDDAIAVQNAVIAGEKQLAAAKRDAAAALEATLGFGDLNTDPYAPTTDTAKAPKSKKQRAAEREKRRLEGLKGAENTPGVSASQDKYTADGIDVNNNFAVNETPLEKQAAKMGELATASRSPVAAARATMKGAQAAMALAIRDHSKNSVEYWNALQQYEDGQNQLADALAAIPTAKAAAHAARVGGAIAGAKAQIVSARAQMRLAEGDQAAYWAGVASFYQGQQALRDAMLAYRKNRMLLGVDMTNPLRMAEVDTRAAAQKLASDQAHGQSRDVIAQDKVDVRTTRANQEATAFNQRLQAVQTADQLGRITHTKYMSYLQHEHDRLSAIRHRTYQQQQELDQIDGLMKDAATAMQGQFNLGDIKLPTPYQVRRYIQQQTGTDAAAASTAARLSAVSSNTYNVYIAAHDVNHVAKVVKEIVGKPARTLTTRPRKR